MMLTRKQRWRRVRVIKIYGIGMGTNDGSPYNFTPQRRRAASDSVLLEAFNFQQRSSLPPVRLKDDPTTTHPTSNSSGGAADTSTRPRARSLDAWSFPGLAILKFFIGDGGRSCVGDLAFSESEERGTNNFGNARTRAGSEGHTLRVRTSRRGSSSWPMMGGGKGRVRFNQQIRVVLVPSRGEMTPFKADVWWGATDYCYFRREYLLATRKQSSIEIEAAHRTCSSANVEQTAEGDGDDEIRLSDATTGSDDESLPPPPPPPSPSSDARKSPSWLAGCAETTANPRVSFRDTDDVAQSILAVGCEEKSELAVPARRMTAPLRNGVESAAIGPAGGNSASVPSLSFLPSSPPTAIESQTSIAADRCQGFSHPNVATMEATSHANNDRLSWVVPRAVENPCVTSPSAAGGTGGGCLLVGTPGSSMLEGPTPVGAVERVAGTGGSMRARTISGVRAATAVPSGVSESAATDVARAAGGAQSAQQREGRNADADLATHREQPREGSTNIPSEMWHMCWDTLTREQIGKLSERFMTNKSATTTGDVAVLAGQVGFGVGKNRNEEARTQKLGTKADNEGARNVLTKSKEKTENGAAATAGGEDKKATRNLPVSLRWRNLVEGVCAVETNGVGGVVGLGFPWRAESSPEADSTARLAKPVSSAVAVGRTRGGSPVMLRTGGRPRALKYTPLPCLGSSPIRRVASF